MFKAKLAVLAFCLAVSTPVAAGEDALHYTIDSAHSHVSARVALLGFAHETASFPDMTGSLTLSLKDFGKVDMDVEVDARTMTAGDGQTGRLRGPQFFDVAHFPAVHFTGEHIRFTSPLTAVVGGHIVARGMTRPAQIQVVFSSPPMDSGGGTALSAVATTSLDRRDFGMKAFPIVVGNQVAVTISAQFLPV